MCNVMLCLSIIVNVVLIVLVYIILKNYKNLKQYYNLLEEDNKYFMKRSFMEDVLIVKLCKKTFQILDEIKSLESFSKVSKFEPKLREICNNIEIIADEDAACNDMSLNINDTFKKINLDNVSIRIDKNIPCNLIYDETRLLSALNLIIEKSINNCINGKIKISIKMIEKKNYNVKLEINIKNIKLSNQSTQIVENIFKSHLIDNIEDPELLIIRNNLFSLKSKINVFNYENTTLMSIEIPMKKQKEKKKIIKALVVDDNKQIATMNQEVLKNIGVDSDIIFDPIECLKILENNMDEYDIVFTDNQMPNMNGTSLIKELRNIEGFNLPVIIVTADDNQNNKFVNFYGFDGYVQKPLSIEKAKEIIDLILLAKR